MPTAPDGHRSTLLAASLALHPKTVSSRLSRCLDKLQAITVRLLAEEKRGHKTSTSV